MAKQTSDCKMTTVVPVHKEIYIGTLLEIMRRAKLARDEFLKLL